MQLLAQVLAFLLMGGAAGSAPAESAATVSESCRFHPRAPRGSLFWMSDSPDQDKKKRKKKKKKSGKKKAEKEKAPAFPEWKHTGAPFSDFIWMAGQLPDFDRFPKYTEKITLSIVAVRKKALVFLDSCSAQKKKFGWRVTDCTALNLKEKDFLARLVRGGTDTTVSADSLKRLKELAKKIRKSRKLKRLEANFTEASMANKQGYRLVDDVKGDLETCGNKRYFDALATMPSPSFVGSHVVVIDLAYLVERKSKSFKVNASLVKTREGWRVGGLRVHCY